MTSTSRLLRRYALTALLASSFCASSFCAPMQAEDLGWPQWRGPHRDGRAAPQELLDSWPENGPQLLWQSNDGGFGFSTPTVKNDKLYTLGKIGDRVAAICIDAKTGKKVWETSFADGNANDKYNTGWGDGPRGTPTIDGDRLYALSDLGILACLDLQSGKIQWSVDFVKDFGGKIPTWGYSESVLIDGDKVIATPGGPNFLVGLDKETGKKVWESKSSHEAQYASIIKADFEGIPTYVTAAKEGLIGTNAITGEELFVNAKTGNQTAVIPTPIVSGNRIYHSSGYGAGNAAVEIKREGSKLIATEIYHNNRQSMENHHGGYILDNGTIYGFSRAMRGVWMAQDLATGDVLWNQKVGTSRSGSIAYADGKLICYDDGEGICYLAEASKDGWKSAGELKIPETTTYDRKQGAIWSHPIVADGKLIIRDHEKLFAYNIAK